MISGPRVFVPARVPFSYPSRSVQNNGRTHNSLSLMVQYLSHTTNIPMALRASSQGSARKCWSSHLCVIYSVHADHWTRSITLNTGVSISRMASAVTGIQRPRESHEATGTVATPNQHESQIMTSKSVSLIGPPPSTRNTGSFVPQTDSNLVGDQSHFVPSKRPVYPQNTPVNQHIPKKHRPLIRSLLESFFGSNRRRGSTSSPSNGGTRIELGGAEVPQKTRKIGDEAFKDQDLFQ